MSAKIVYADDTTPGAIVVVAPTDAGDMVSTLGYLVDEDEIVFNFIQQVVEVP